MQFALQTTESDAEFDEHQNVLKLFPASFVVANIFGLYIYAVIC